MSEATTTLCSAEAIRESIKKRQQYISEKESEITSTRCDIRYVKVEIHYLEEQLSRIMMSDCQPQPGATA